MHVTKLEHAALHIGKGAHGLLVDPGAFTAPLTELADVEAVVITHEHADHWTPEHLRAVHAAVGDVPVFGPAGVARAAAGFDITVVAPGETRSVGPFRLAFFGGRHAVIHESMPVVDNVGVLVDDAFYYPGDSFAAPAGVAVDLLAAPVGAPWLKIGDAMDFVLAVAPRRAFATHDGTLSAAGLRLGRERLEWAVQQHGGTFLRLDPGDDTDV